MTTNEASRAEFEKWAAAQHFILHVRNAKGASTPGKYASFDTQIAWEAWQAALASRPTTIDPIHGDKREVIINALCASSNWMRGYAEAFVDDFVGCDEWLPIESAPRDGTPVLLIGAPNMPERCDWLTGLQFVGRCTSDLTEWSFAAPVGMGGIPTSWLAGWMPLPAAPAPGKGGEV